MTRGRRHSENSAFAQLQQLAVIALQEEEDQKPNPVTQRVKIIMSAGLVLVHAHSRLLASAGDGGQTVESYADPSVHDGTLNDASQYLTTSTPLWQFYIHKSVKCLIDNFYLALLAV